MILGLGEVAADEFLHGGKGLRADGQLAAEVQGEYLDGFCVVLEDELGSLVLVEGDILVVSALDGAQGLVGGCGDVDGEVTVFSGLSHYGIVTNCCILVD